MVVTQWKGLWEQEILEPLEGAPLNAPDRHLVKITSSALNKSVREA